MMLLGFGGLGIRMRVAATRPQRHDPGDTTPEIQRSSRRPNTGDKSQVIMLGDEHQGGTRGGIDGAD
jgi:hypothetical protein